MRFTRSLSSSRSYWALNVSYDFWWDALSLLQSQCLADVSAVGSSQSNINILVAAVLFHFETYLYHAIFFFSSDILVAIANRRLGSKKEIYTCIPYCSFAEWPVHHLYLILLPWCSITTRHLLSSLNWDVDSTFFCCSTYLYATDGPCWKVVQRWRMFSLRVVCYIWSNSLFLWPEHYF